MVRVMNSRHILRNSTSERRDNRRILKRLKKLHMFTVFVTGITALLLTILPVRPVGQRAQASTADLKEDSAEFIPAGAQPSAGSVLPPGLQEIVQSMSRSYTEGSVIKRLGTSCETVMVGQRVQTVKKSSPNFGIGEQMQRHVSELCSQADRTAEEASMMSDYDYESLLKIVEAEAGTEDLEGRILVANVILNRVRHKDFPDTVADVIYQYEDGIAQFQPVADGRIYAVEVSDLTREAVRQAMSGTDHSQGAIYFIQREYADYEGVSWFDQSLKPLFKHGVHEFYTDL